MSKEIHPNISLLSKLNIGDLDSCANIIAEDFIWHYFNPELPKLKGDYYGFEGLKDFFAKLNEKSNSSFQVNVIDTHSVGDELVVTQVCNHMNLDGSVIEFDAVVIWRIVYNKIVEGWDIPAVNTIRILQKS